MSQFKMLEVTAENLESALAIARDLIARQHPYNFSAYIKLQGMTVTLTIENDSVYFFEYRLEEHSK